MKGLSRTLAIATSTAGLGVALAVPGAVVLADAGHGVRTIASGFAGPLHLSVAPNGQIYVADAFLGQIDRVDPSTGSITPVVTGLGFSPGVDVHGGQIFFTNSHFPESETEQGSTSLLRATPDGTVKTVADMLAYELANNPDGQPRRDDADSNPYAVLALPGRTLVADAAGNALIEVRPNGRMRTLTVFPVSYAGECATATNNGVPNGGCDPVPTDIALGPDGFLYVSGLGAEVEGFVWKVDATTGQIVSTRGGLPPLTGIAVGDDGSVYASSLFADTIFRFAPSGAVSTATVTGPTGLDYARGVLYAASVDFSGGPGSVVAVSPAAFHP
ncbi:MAG TPA: ScyD/ScyE family protein [Mycobacteriales bacterium]|nr:ScyD/ScyE family protein [Mycobacteriales bacterium]